jgi:hypothetical protein
MAFNTLHWTARKDKAHKAKASKHDSKAKAAGAQIGK